MKIYATFANRKDDVEAIELVHAWDEYCVDNNPTGYEDTKRADLASWGEELLRHVTVELEVPMRQIYDALDPQVSLGCSVTHVGEVSR